MEAKILEAAVQQLNQLEGIECQVLGYEVRIGNQQVDAQLLLKRNGFQKTYNVEIKTKIVPAQIPDLKDRIERLAPCMIIAEYITTQAKQILQKEQIPYLDTAGNIFLNDNGIYLHIETNKTNRTKLITGNRAFNKAGLKVIYQFLIHPEYINKPYRFIGEHATVTIDTVSGVIKGLLAEKYILRKNDKEYQFLDRKRLFQEWVTGFNKILRPKLKQNRYRWLEKNQKWQNIKMPNNAYWGGAVAAEQLTNYLIADTITIYTRQHFTDVMKDLKLIPDPKGKVTLIEVFWENEAEHDLVHPFLIYADLLHDANPRYIETANMIYKNYVEDKL